MDKKETINEKETINNKNDKVETQKDFKETKDTKENNFNDKKDYNNNESLESLVQNERDNRYLAKTIVAMEEKYASLDAKIDKLLAKIDSKGNDFTDSKINDSQTDNQWLIDIKS